MAGVGLVARCVHVTCMGRNALALLNGFLNINEVQTFQRCSLTNTENPLRVYCRHTLSGLTVPFFSPRQQEHPGLKITLTVFFYVSTLVSRQDGTLEKSSNFILFPAALHLFTALHIASHSSSSTRPARLRRCLCSYSIRARKKV